MHTDEHDFIQDENFEPQRRRVPSKKTTATTCIGLCPLHQ
jgi:hypothetical protein